MSVAESIGEQELALLRHIADRDSASVAETVDGYGAERGLARSTVLTMMERLRKRDSFAEHGGWRLPIRHCRPRQIC